MTTADMLMSIRLYVACSIAHPPNLSVLYICQDPSINNQQTVNKMFVGGLKDDTTEDMVRDAFSQFGEIKEIELINDKATGKSKGFCFVTFEDYDSVDKCVCKLPFFVTSV